MTELLSAYSNLLERMREVALLNSSAALLAWDQETYMPRRAVGFRAEQLSYLHGRAHRLFTDPKVNGWIAAGEEHDFESDAKVATNIREWRRMFDRNAKIPVEVVEAMVGGKITKASEAPMNILQTA